MSLLDALLNEGYRDPRDIYIALRSDGLLGSGRVDDPFHVGVVETSPIGATLTLVVSANPREIIVTTSSAHGYIEGDIVVLSGTTDLNGAPAQSFDGPYQITVAALPANQFKCYLDFPVASSFTGQGFVRKRIFLLDQLLRGLNLPVPQSNLAIHFGPGVFETRGMAGAFAGSLTYGTQGWEVGPGWKLRGSGINVTTLKLAEARGAPDIALYFVIGAKTWYLHADYAEASDLTLDCNAQGNQRTSVAAIILTGSHTRIRRVRAINWGAQADPESFVVSVGGTHPLLPEVTDCVIEDCIAEQPGPTNTWTTTILGVIGTVSVPEEKPAFFRGSAIRRNFVSGDYTRNEVPIESIAKSGSGAGAIATVTTKVPHGRKPGDWVVIAGALVWDGLTNPYLNPLNNPYNGSHRIDSTPSPTTFTYALIVGAGQTEPSVNPVGEMFVDRFPSHYLTATNVPPSIVSTDDPLRPDQYRLTTFSPHNRIAGGNVVINGVYVDVPFAEYTNAFNGSHVVDEVLSPTELTFTVHPTATRPKGQIKWLPTDDNPSYTLIRIGESTQVGAGGGVCQVMERNCVVGVTAGAYTDTYSTKSVHVRKNHFHRVSGWGVNRTSTNYLTPPPGPIPGSCLVYSFANGKHIATYTSIQPHGLSPGSQVTVGGAVVAYGASPPLPYANVYNGTFTVLAVPSPNQFQYELSAVPPGFGSSANVPTNAGGSPVFSAGGTLNVITAQSLGPLTAGTKTARFISQGPHGFNDGEIVSVLGAKMDTPAGGTFFNPYNGVFVITKVNDTEFTYLMTSVPSDNALTSPAPMCAKQVGTSLTRVGTVATYRTVRPHFLEKGQIVRVDNALVGGSTANPFNGEKFALISVGQTSFSYEVPSVPATHAYGAVSYAGKDYEAVAQVENNLIELLPQALPLPAAGVVAGPGMDFRPNYVFRQVAVRDNLIRYPDNALDFGQWSVALSCWNCGTLLIEDNVMALERPAPIHFNLSGTVSCVNNRTPQGTPIKANDVATGVAPYDPAAQVLDTYFPAAEDAMILAF